MDGYWSIFWRGRQAAAQALRGRACLIALLALAALTPAAFGWGPEGHRVVGDIAAELIRGTPAEARVRALLGGTDLAQAGVWADCVKGIDPAQGFRDATAGRYPECAVYEDASGEAAMSDFVRRNAQGCGPAGGELCHRRYHYTDVALQRDRYQRGWVGTSGHDIVAALEAAIARLRGRPVPAPFDLKDEREALRLLVHLVGDLHQPLHVGAVYLDAQGRPVDPDTAGFDPASTTRGGNGIELGAAGNLHRLWDAAPAALTPPERAALTGAARRVPPSPGAPPDWPALWATETLAQARVALDGLRYGARESARDGERWPALLPADYRERVAAITRVQLAAAGARLAQLLRALWP